MKSVQRSRCKPLVLAVALFSLLGVGVLVFGQESETTKTGMPDGWSYHHLIFSNPGTAGQAIAKGRFLDW